MSRSTSEAVSYADEALTLYREWMTPGASPAPRSFRATSPSSRATSRRHGHLSRTAWSDSPQLGAEHDVQLVLFNLSWACEELGDDMRARELENECLRRARASGIPRDVAFALDLQSSRARDDGRLDVALDAALEALRIRRDEGDVQHELDGLSRVAAIHARAHRMETAARLLSSSLHLHEEHGMIVPLYQEERNAETLALIQIALDEQTLATAWDEGRAMSLDEAVTLALAVPE